MAQENGPLATVTQNGANN